MLRESQDYSEVLYGFGHDQFPIKAYRHVIDHEYVTQPLAYVLNP